MVIGMHDKHPHQVTGTKQNENALGELESNIYRDSDIRTEVYELFEDEVNRTGRVVVVEVPSRPIGKVYKFEDVPLMRVGEDLLPMDDKTYLSIIQEQEPDFSEQFCDEATFDDLDPEAIKEMKEKYAKKQENLSFVSLDDKQALSDLHLIVGNRITNAAVLLVGKEDFINRVFPQAKVMLEYRTTEAQIHFDNRMQFGQPFFLLIDKLWDAINLRNGSVPIREGAYIFGIPFFNEDVIREVANNAFAHRNYRVNSEIMVKQYPTKLVIINAGGFPKGVTIDNLLTTPSMPRNRLLADILAKTGIVERSGQGMDKIFLKTLSEGKPDPDYTESDDFNVTAILSATVKDKAFAIYVQSIQQSLPEDKKLTVFDVMALCEVRDGKKVPSNKLIAQKLEQMGFLEKHGKTNAIHYILPRRYYEFAGDVAAYSLATDWVINQVWAVIKAFLMKYGKAKRTDLDKIVGNHVSEKQMRRFLDTLREDERIVTKRRNERLLLPLVSLQRI
jgi:ATP-dependent DNA helicase RecG